MKAIIVSTIFYFKHLLSSAYPMTFLFIDNLILTGNKAYAIIQKKI